MPDITLKLARPARATPRLHNSGIPGLHGAETPQYRGVAYPRIRNASVLAMSNHTKSPATEPKDNQSMDPIADKIDQLYATLPDIKCKRRCQAACGPIMMSKAEANRIKERLQRPVKPNSDLSCPMLSIMGSCTIYDIRPMICRLYGLANTLQCEHGCVPKRWLEDTEAKLLLQQLNDLSGTTDPFTLPFTMDANT